MDEFDRLMVLALGGGGLMNIIVGLVTQFATGPEYHWPVNYILGGFLLGMLVGKFGQLRQEQQYEAVE